jgi:hypothetical protein
MNPTRFTIACHPRGRSGSRAIDGKGRFRHERSSLQIRPRVDTASYGPRVQIRLPGHRGTRVSILQKWRISGAPVRRRFDNLRI